jgi:hypothetical protein
LRLDNLVDWLQGQVGLEPYREYQLQELVDHRQT